PLCSRESTDPLLPGDCSPPGGRTRFSFMTSLRETTLGLSADYSRAAEDETELTGILGGSKFENGAWMVNTSSLVTVMAGRPPRVLVFDSSYKGGLRFSDESYSLQITDLRLEDTGSYSVEFNTDKEQFAYREFTLRVSSKCWGRGIPEGAWNPPRSGNS
uniref:Immunoglobulin subtype domain-containing protein n=1 Tax=Gopherus agassizii TaxID=38772 RepID=A0A452HA40_9SAUR